MEIDPKKGPNEGVGVVNFFGSGFRNDNNLLNYGCRLGENYGTAEFVNEGKVKCIVNNMELVTEGDFL